MEMVRGSVALAKLPDSSSVMVTRSGAAGAGLAVIVNRASVPSVTRPPPATLTTGTTGSSSSRTVTVAALSGRVATSYPVPDFTVTVTEPSGSSTESCTVGTL